MSERNLKHHMRDLTLMDDNSSFGYKEAFKALRTNVRYLLPDDGTGKVILLTSSAPAEGKSNVSINLAYAFAQDNKRVLLMDGDLRKGTLHQYLNVSSLAVGLSAVLTGRHSVNEAVIHVGLGFDFLPVGTLPTNPSELAGSQAMVDLLSYLQGVYDFIIIDTAPVTAVADTGIMARYADGVILVVAHNETTRAAAKAAKESLQQANANILGVVLNKYDSKESSQDYGYYSYYNYSNYGYENKEK